eukprot:GEMP01041793.1.p1 GENE.GEMP01041793.1~~GEMP01041793.1.p1  ORF type:complete len:283 (+),score=56.82 GEMP01041793.1:593-1441(+)
MGDMAGSVTNFKLWTERTLVSTNGTSDADYLNNVLKPAIAPLIHDLKRCMPAKPCEFIAQWAEDVPTAERDRYFDEQCRPTIEALTAALLHAKPRSPRRWLKSAHLQLASPAARSHEGSRPPASTYSSEFDGPVVSLIVDDSSVVKMAGAYHQHALGWFTLSPNFATKLPVTLRDICVATGRKDICRAWAEFVQTALLEFGAREITIRSTSGRTRDNVQIVLIDKRHQVKVFTRQWVPVESMLGVCVIPAHIRGFESTMDPSAFFDSGAQHGAIAIDNRERV